MFTMFYFSGLAPDSIEGSYCKRESLGTVFDII